ncbi:MAG TPA: hypothetical protein VKP11_07310, partial [Frankiaceae bacterium]|nr:hypothetical protein [Frankiaceae bacterium]
AVLRAPRRWPKFDVLLARVSGGGEEAAEGQRLLAVGRGLPVRIPIDVRRVVPRKALHLTVHTLPGLREEVERVLVPAARGGTDVVTVIRADGPLAPLALLPLWLCAAITLRRLARRAEEERRRRLRAASGVA